MTKVCLVKRARNAAICGATTAPFAARKQQGSSKDDSGAFFTRRELQLGEENRVVRMTIGRSECE